MTDKLAAVEDEIAKPFFEAAAAGRLSVQRCDGCGALRWPPLPSCPECRGQDTTWVEVAPSGTVWSFVVYHRAFQRSLADQIPYTVAMVQLDDGPYLVGRLAQGERKPIVGDRVNAEFLDIDGVSTVRWRLA
jgi:uncharacterized OB-fold protein